MFVANLYGNRMVSVTSNYGFVSVHSVLLSVFARGKHADCHGTHLCDTYLLFTVLNEADRVATLFFDKRNTLTVYPCEVAESGIIIHISQKN